MFPPDLVLWGIYTKNAFRRFESVYRPEKMRKARKCICKISKNFRVKKSGEKIVGSRVFAFGEDSLALRLVSKLPDLRAANADLHSAPVAQNRTKPRLPQPTQKPPNRVAFVLCRVADLDAKALVADLDAR